MKKMLVFKKNLFIALGISVIFHCSVFAAVVEDCGRWNSTTTDEQKRTWRIQREDLNITLEKAGMGNLLYVDPQLTGIDPTYISGNAPYLTYPPGDLDKRSMLDLLASPRFGTAGHVFSRDDAVALTYLNKINAQLRKWLERKKEGLDVVKELITGFLSHSSVVSPYKIEMECLQKWIQTEATVNENYDSISSFLNTSSKKYSNLQSEYEQRLTAYRNIQYTRYATLIKGWNKENSPTHTEIMYLDDVSQCVAGVVQGMISRLNPGMAATLIFSTKPMCENCERAIVKAWKGAGELIVVSERPSNSDEQKREDISANVQKVNLPSNII